MSIVSINFNFAPHKNIIMKLCERNNFYEGDIYFEIFKDFPWRNRSHIHIQVSFDI